MGIYIAYVKTNAEKHYLKLWTAQNPKLRGIRLCIPERTLVVRRQGVALEKSTPLFRGYVFVEVEDDSVIIKHKSNFARTEGFLRFLPSNAEPRELQGKDLELACHFIHRHNNNAGLSTVFFDENERIVVKEGPLLGLEGRIVKVDRRKKRAKVKLDIYNDSFLVDLGFEILGK